MQESAGEAIAPAVSNKLWYPFDRATWQNTESYLDDGEKEKLCW